MKKVIIIGSGMAGLTAGAYLSREGFDVTIYEQFDSIGGVTATIHKDGFSWDIGPLLLEGFAPHEKLGKILKELGIDDQIEVIKEDRGIWFPDFKIWHPDEYQGPYWRRQYLKELFPEDSEGLEEYYKFYDRMLKVAYLNNLLPFTNGINTLFIKLRLLFAFLKVKKYENWSASQITDYFFSNQKLKAIYLGILADMVVKPSEFFGLGVPLFNIETAFDKRIPIKFKGRKNPVYHYVKNGCEELVNAFAKFIRNNGGILKTNSKVEKIIIEGGKATGVRLGSGEIIKADLVISSGGMFNVFYNMVGKEHLSEDFIKSIEKITLMESVFMVHIGIDFDPTPYQRAALCYYYQTYDIEGAIDVMRKGKYHEGRNGYLIYIPSMHSPEMAPSGKHSVTVYTVAPHKLKEGNWDEKRDNLADKLLIEAEKIIPGLREHTQVRIIMTPDDFLKRINVLRHSFGGTAPKLGQQNPSHKTPIKNLWYIGAYSESGGGIMGVVDGTRSAIKNLLEESKE
jgi:all-trans-retinol 13,14-reductase